MKKILSVIFCSCFFYSSAFAIQAIDAEKGKVYPVVGAISIANGGTGGTDAQSAIDSLLGSTTTGNIIQYNGTHWVPVTNGATLWTNNSSFDYLTTYASHKLGIGTTAAENSAWVSIVSHADVPALNVNTPSGQTANIANFAVDGVTKAYIDSAGGVYSTGSGGGAINLGGATSGTITVIPAAVAGTNTITLPAATGTFALTADPIFTSSLQLPNGANPTTDAAGEVAVDTSATSGAAIRFYGDAAYELHAWRQKSFVIISPTASDDYVMFRTPYAITIKAIHVLCTGGTNIIGGLDEGDSNGANVVAVDSDITASAGTMAADDGSLTNPTIASGGTVNWHTTSISGTPTAVMVTFDYTEDQVN